MILKKIISIAAAAVILLTLQIGASAVGHTSADQVFGADGTTDLASVGNNDVTGTSLGTITDEKLTLWGWYADERKISEFGYRYGDSVTLGSAKYIGADDATIAGQAGALGYADGESVRFRIENIPVVKGENVELYAVAKLEDGETVDIWRLTYSSENGIDMPGATPATPDTNGAESSGNAENPQTADASVTAAAFACVTALFGCAALTRRKKK